MAKYITKPVIIEAEQYIGNHIDGIEYINNESFIRDKYGYRKVDIGDFIVDGLDGRYLCKPDDFYYRFEKLEQLSTTISSYKDLGLPNSD